MDVVTKIVRFGSDMCGSHSVIKDSAPIYEGGYFYPVYSNETDDIGDTTTVVHHVFNFRKKLVADCSANDFKISEMLRSGIVPTVVSPMSFYTGNKCDLAVIGKHCGIVLSDGLAAKLAEFEESQKIESETK